MGGLSFSLCRLRTAHAIQENTVRANIEPLCVSIIQAAKMLSLSRSQIYNLIKAGELKLVKLTEKRSAIEVAVLKAYLARRRAASTVSGKALPAPTRPATRRTRTVSCFASQSACGRSMATVVSRKSITPSRRRTRIRPLPSAGSSRAGRSKTGLACQSPIPTRYRSAGSKCRRLASFSILSRPGRSALPLLPEIPASL